MRGRRKSRKRISSEALSSGIAGRGAAIAVERREGAVGKKGGGISSTSLEERTIRKYVEQQQQENEEEEKKKEEYHEVGRRDTGPRSRAQHCHEAAQGKKNCPAEC